MLDAIRDRYGVWVERALLGVTEGNGRVTWPGRGEYDSRVGIFVGPDGRRWIWCNPPPGQLNMPNDLRVEGIQVTGRTTAGQDYTVPTAAPTALSAGSDKPTQVLLRIESPDFTMRRSPRQNGPAQVEWTLINALFDGVDWSPDPTVGPSATRLYHRRWRTGEYDQPIGHPPTSRLRIESHARNHDIDRPNR
jgi:hypothetical protein